MSDVINLDLDEIERSNSRLELMRRIPTTISIADYQVDWLLQFELKTGCKVKFPNEYKGFGHLVITNINSYKNAAEELSQRLWYDRPTEERY